MPANPISGSIGNKTDNLVDTGTGGFPIDGVTNTYDIGDINALGITATTSVPWSSGQINVDKTPKDLSKDTKTTLASYLSKTTLGKTNSSPTPVSNTYPIEHNLNSPPVDISLKDKDGYPQPLSATAAAQPHYANLDQGRSVNATSLNVVRGREKPAQGKTVDGHVLLSTAMKPMTGVFNPPEPGSINAGSLNSDNPVKTYTETAITAFANNNDRFVPTDKSPPLRNLSQLETLPYNGLAPQDIAPDKKTTLTSYLSKTTEKNAYPIDNLSVEEKTVDNSGNPVSPHKTLNVRSYTPFTSENMIAVSYGLKKGKETSPAKVDGHSLLKDLPLEKTTHKEKPISKLAPGSVVGEFYSAVMLSNRFSSEMIYEDNNGINSKQFAKKYPMGRSISPEDPIRDLTFGRLAQIGNVLSLRASQELNSLHDEFNPTNGPAATGALLPGKAQLGVEKISASELTAASVITQLTDAGIGEELLINPAGESWGSLNNIQDEFSGISAFGMQLLAIALMVALSVIMLAMSALFLIPAGGDTSRTTDDIERRTFGSYTEDKFSQDKSVAGIISAMFTGNFNFWRMIGVEGTAHSLEKCLPTGTLAFFGISSSDTSFGTMAGEITKGAVSVTESPGYYSVIARNVSRSYLQIGDAFSSIGKAFASGMTSGVKQLLSIIEIFRSSKFIRILNVFAHLGDQVLLESAKRDENSRGSGTRYLSRIDEANNNAPGKSRITYNKKNKELNVGPLTLSWASYRARDALIIPNNITKFLLGTQLEGVPVSDTLIKQNLDESHAGSNEGGLKGVLFRKTGEESRISTEDRENIESQLNAEYVPFYMHDVRTNEIISFHAFLASLSDDYTANYNSAEGIGRVETIKIYKSTNRKIAFSFYIVATNEKDFDSMWLKINKLTTMVYPQFSEGRRISLGENSVIMPFSQIIQAPPMIRLRIGDLIQSNYSKFNLARLFGLDSPNSKLNKKTMSDTETIDAILTKSKPEDILKDYTFTSTQAITMPGMPTSDYLPRGLVFKCLETPDKNLDTCKCIISIASDDDMPEGISADVLKKTYSGEYMERYSYIDKIVNMFKTSLIPTTSTVKTRKREQEENIKKLANYQTEVSDFMNNNASEKGNAIVKSFRSSGGHGLAGFIDSMNFDWYDKVTWETEQDRKAPKMCKVTISFSPTHDITPGLDHSGFNRAPIYPVKSLLAPPVRHDMNVISNGNK